jgi:ABC-type transport system involved in cytochrome c biogenesis permease subunit
MLSGVSIMCFTASYAVALALEVTRFFFRSSVRGMVMIGFAAAGLFAHTVFLWNRAAHATGAPLSSQQDWYLITAWIFVAGYLYVTCWQRKTSMGLFLLPVVFVLIGAAAWFADPRPFDIEPAIEIWGMTHGVSILLATVVVLVGFLSGLMYLFQAYLLKHKVFASGFFRLPSLEWLQDMNRRAMLVAAPLMGVGVLAGVVLNSIHQPHQLPWKDPLSLITLIAFAWLVVAGLVSSLYQPMRHSRKVAYLTLLSFLVLAAMLGVGLFAGTQHRKLQARATVIRHQPGGTLPLGKLKFVSRCPASEELG